MVEVATDRVAVLSGAHIVFVIMLSVFVERETVCVGIGTTVKVITLGREVQPEADSPITVYVVVTVGDAETVAPVLLLKVNAGDHV
jgi:hypothetical protein